MWILVAMVFIMPFEKHPWLRFTSDFTLIKLIGIVGLLWSAAMVASGRVHLRLFEPRQARAFFAFAGVMLVAAAATGAETAPLQRLVNTMALLPFVLAAVRSERGLRAILATGIATLVLVFPYAFRNAMRYGGRFGVGLYEPNYFALIMVLLVPIGFVLARHEPERGRRRLLYAATAVLALECFLTGSRGGVLGLGTAILLMIARFTRRRVLGFVIVLAAALGLVLSPTGAGQRLRSGWLEIGEAETDVDMGVQVSNTHRKELIRAGLSMIQANPLAGVGLGRFKERSVDYGSLANNIAHNTYLEIAAESGLPALLAFLWLLYVTQASLRAAAARARAAGRRSLADLATAMRTSLTAYFVSIVFLSAQFEKFFWLIVFASICVARIANEAAAEERASPVPAGALLRGGPAPWWSHERAGSGSRSR